MRYDDRYGRRGRSPYDRDMGRASGYDRGMRGGRGRGPQGPDYWWLGEREMERMYRPTSYDDAYRRFDEQHHPRYSPVGGMYGPIGGGYDMERGPRPLRDATWFSDWTRWF